jgi:hypothetical protein
VFLLSQQTAFVVFVWLVQSTAVHSSPKGPQQQQTTTTTKKQFARRFDRFVAIFTTAKFFSRKGMTRLVVVWLWLAVGLMCSCREVVMGAPKLRHAKAAPAKKVVKLNVDILPPLQEVLAELGLDDRLHDFVRMGITETRLLLKLGAMDFQIMTMDWNDFGAEQVSSLKQKIQILYQMAVVPEESVRPELELRKKLTYGRVYSLDGVQSFEYSLASFGGPPPLGPLSLTLSKSLFECNTSGVEDYQGGVVLVKRGECTFLHKALNLKANNASGMFVVSFEAQLETPSSGLGVDKRISEQVVNSLDNFFVIQSVNTSWESLRRTVLFHEQQNQLPTIHIVPLKCRTGGHCDPLTAEEKSLQDEVSWGRLRVRRASFKSQSKTFEFLTSNFGAFLPVGFELPVVKASSPLACEPVQNISAALIESHRVSGVAMIAQRGGCRFDIKARHAQDSGARVLIVYDPEDKPLQRLGGMLPELPFVGIPTVLATVEIGEFLEEGDMVEFFPARDITGLEHWLEIAHMEWSDNDRDRLMQLEGMVSRYQDTDNHDVVSWLQRRINEIQFRNKKPIDTDEF